MAVHNRIRPSGKTGAFFHLRVHPDRPPLRVIAAPGDPRPSRARAVDAAPGTVLGVAGGLRVACADGVY
jgi:hypothetical protein